MRTLIPRHHAHLADDPIFALSRQATERVKRGEPTINATLGALLNDDGTLSIMGTVTRVLHSVPATEAAAYAPISGDPRFLQAVIADACGRDGRLPTLATAVATPGGTGALRHAITMFLEPGEALLTTDAYWAPYQTLAEENGRRVETFSMFAPDGAWNVHGLEDALTRTARNQSRTLLVLNDPCHNPTGYSMTESDWRGVRDVLSRHAKQHPTTLLIDSAYAAFGDTPVSSLLEILTPCLDDVLVLVAWSASKSFTHYGLRVGALVALTKDQSERDRLAAAFAYASRGTWSNCNRAGMWAIASCLTDPELAQACDHERRLLTQLLSSRVAKFKDASVGTALRYPPYRGGFFVSVYADEPLEVAERLRREGVFVVPVPGALRVALCAVAAADVPRLVATMDRALSVRTGAG